MPEVLYTTEEVPARRRSTVWVKARTSPFAARARCSGEAPDGGLHSSWLAVVTAKEVAAEADVRPKPVEKAESVYATQGARGAGYALTQGGRQGSRARLSMAEHWRPIRDSPRPGVAAAPEANRTGV